MTHSRLAAALALVVAAAATHAEPAPIVWPLSDPQLGWWDAGLELGIATDYPATFGAPTEAEFTDLVSDRREDLDGIPDRDGLPLATVRGVGRRSPVPGRPIGLGEFGLRLADLTAGDRAPDRYTDGGRIEEGISTRARAHRAFAPSSRLAVHLSPDLGASPELGAVRWTRASAVLRVAGARVTLGREPRWWGPGRLHEVMISTNARPGDGIEIATDGAPKLGVLGHVRGSVFVSYLDDRHRPSAFPLLFGHRTAWRPASWVELGAERTIMLGGVGRTENYTGRDLVNIFLGRNENTTTYDGFRDTDQKVGFDVSITPTALARAIPGVRGLRGFYRYAGDDGFVGLLPSRVSHHYGFSVSAGSSRLEAEYFESVASGVWYWNNEYPAGYTYRGDFLATDLGWDARSLRVRLTHAVSTRWGLRAEYFHDSRGHEFTQGEFVRPVPGGEPSRYPEFGIAVAHRLQSGRRVVAEIRRRWAPDGYAFDADRQAPRLRFNLTIRGV